MKPQSYHSYRRRLDLLFHAQLADMRRAVAEWDAPMAFGVLKRHKYLQRMARRNFDRSRQKPL